MTARKPRRERPPLDQAKLQELALRYVGRFATTRAKLASYLQRKVRERGWAGEDEADVRALVEKFASQGYVDDAGYALSKSRSLASRGYGQARLHQSLRAAGVAEQDSAEARGHAERHRVDAALRFAERRKLGPFAGEALKDPRARDRALAAMLRAGHSFGLSRAIIALEPGAEVRLEGLGDSSRGSD